MWIGIEEMGHILGKERFVHKLALDGADLIVNGADMVAAALKIRLSCGKKEVLTLLLVPQVSCETFNINLC